MDNLSIKGWVAASGRGRVTGVGLKGMVTGYNYTVGFSNTNAQYWTTTDATTGYFSKAGILPGSYAMSVFKGEFAGEFNS